MPTPHRQSAEHFGDGCISRYRLERPLRCSDACEQLKARLAPVAARLLGCAAEAVRFESGCTAGVTFAEVVEAAYRERIALSAAGYYRTPGLNYDPRTGHGKPFHYFAYGAAVSEVEVDGFTGEYRFLRTDLLQDVGDSVSPVIDMGQVEGGFIQGLGWLTLEELVWNDNGRLATDGASTYKLPSRTELPEDFRTNFLTRAAEPGVGFR